MVRFVTEGPCVVFLENAVSETVSVWTELVTSFLEAFSPVTHTNCKLAVPKFTLSFWGKQRKEVFAFKSRWQSKRLGW